MSGNGTPWINPFAEVETWLDYPHGDALTASQLILGTPNGVGRYDILNREVTDDGQNLVVELTVRLFDDSPPHSGYTYCQLPED